MTANQGAAPFIRPYTPSGGETAICLDDRWAVALADGEEPLPEDEQFLSTQIGGGRHGAIIIAKTVQLLHGSVDPEADGFLAEGVDETLKAAEIKALDHDACAARLFELEVSEAVAAGGDSLRRLASEVSGGELERPLFDKIVTATGNQAMRRAIPEPDRNRFVWLAPVYHAGERLAVMHGPDMALDVRAAYKAGEPTYGLSRGRLDGIFSPLAEAGLLGAVGVGEGGYLARAVNDVRTAAIVQYLRWTTGKDIVVEHYGR